MDLSSHLRTPASIANAATTIDGPAPRVTIDGIRAELARLHRTILCRPECVERIQAEIDAQGLGATVRVVGSSFVPEGEILITGNIPRHG